MKIRYSFSFCPHFEGRINIRSFDYNLCSTNTEVFRTGQSYPHFLKIRQIKGLDRDIMLLASSGFRGSELGRSKPKNRRSIRKNIFYYE